MSSTASLMDLSPSLQSFLSCLAPIEQQQPPSEGWMRALETLHAVESPARPDQLWSLRVAHAVLRLATLSHPPFVQALERLAQHPLPWPSPLSAWLLTPTALEALQPDMPLAFPRFEWDMRPPLTPEALRLVQRLPPVQVGPDLEPKLRLVHLHSQAQSPAQMENPPVLLRSASPCCTVAALTWTQARTFHRALERVMQQAESFQLRVGWLLSLLRGEQLLPDILAVHVVVVSADQQLLLLERAPHLSYYPGHWSASLEEQVCHRDLEASVTPFEAAALRGLEEELSIPTQRVKSGLFLGYFLDLAYLSVGGMVLLTLTQTRAELERELERERLGETTHTPGEALGEGSERRGFAFMPVEPNILAEAGEGRGPLAGLPLHPTARLRIKALQRRLFSDFLPSAPRAP